MDEIKTILVTGANGFIAKNLIVDLERQEKFKLLKVTRTTSRNDISSYCKQADFIFHLAGVNRPKDSKEFYEGNRDFTFNLLSHLKDANSKAPIVMSSSIQAITDNEYGKSKLAAESLLFEYAKENNSKAMIYRLPNVFGKWSKPNYNSVIATFCHKISRNEDIVINGENPELNLIYIDDILKEFNQALTDTETRVNEFCEVHPIYSIRLNTIVDLLISFKESRNTLEVPNTDDIFSKKLYSTYLSYIPEKEFSYPLKMNIDKRGSFTEILKTQDRGQVSVNISKTGITKGNHWHHTKNEKFLVVSGTGVIRFRKINDNKVLEYFVSEEKLEVIDIPIGYTHNIENIGEKDMVTIMWANEFFDPENPDTYYEEV